MKNNLKKGLCIVIICIMLFATFSTSSFAMVEAKAVVKQELSLSGVGSRDLSVYATVPLVHNGKSLGNIARLINGVVYIPIRQFVETVSGAKVTYYSATKTLTVTGEGHDISVNDGAFVFYAGGRPIFERTPTVLMNNGRMYAPLTSVAKALSLTSYYDGTIAYTNGRAASITPADKYYDSDAVYWLSRIISAESKGEPLLGQISVGSVVMNRVKSADFPNTIWGVIFDRKYGVQFSPVANGTIYEAPTYNAVLAAKICLEGYRASEDILYFVNPEIIQGSWLQRTREYAFSVKHHDFYK